MRPGCACGIGGRGSSGTCCRTSSSPSSRQKTNNSGRDWAWQWRRALWISTAARSRSIPRWAKVRISSSRCRSKVPSGSPRERYMSAANKGRILIVDDELVVRDSLARWFAAEGYETRPVTSAREALELADREWDLALLDIKMPGMDGIELEARLKEADPDLIVIMMTGYATVETAIQALKRGAYDYLTKPIDPDELSHLVGKALEHRRTKREVVRLQENLQEIFPQSR